MKQAFSWVRSLRAFLLQPHCLLSWVSSTLTILQILALVRLHDHMRQFHTINLIHIISDSETHGRLSSPCWGAEPDCQALAGRADLRNLPPFLPGILGSAGSGCCRGLSRKRGQWVLQGSQHPGTAGGRQGAKVKGVPGFSRLFREEDGFALPVFMTPNHRVRSQTPLVLSEPTAWHFPTSSCRPLGQCRLRGCFHVVRVSGGRSCVVWFLRCPARQRLSRDIALHSAKTASRSARVRMERRREDAPTL